MAVAKLIVGVVAAGMALGFGPASSAAQIPDHFENLRVLPKDITRDSLIQVMRGFSFALGVSCQHCHAGGDGISFEGVSFKSDAKPAKRNARYMLQMVDTINRRLLAALPMRSEPAISIQCVTCHRGLAKPATLASTLAATIESAGVDSAVRQYRRLRETTTLDGLYSFDEWEVNELARHLTATGKTADAIIMLEMNAEYYPQSAAIDLLLADLHRERGERDKAITSYRQVLQKAPLNQTARRRLAEYGAAIP